MLLAQFLQTAQGTHCTPLVICYIYYSTDCLDASALVLSVLIEPNILRSSYLLLYREYILLPYEIQLIWS